MSVDDQFATYRPIVRVWLMAVTGVAAITAANSHPWISRRLLDSVSLECLHFTWFQRGLPAKYQAGGRTVLSLGKLSQVASEGQSRCSRRQLLSDASFCCG